MCILLRESPVVAVERILGSQVFRAAIAEWDKGRTRQDNASEQLVKPRGRFERVALPFRREDDAPSQDSLQPCSPLRCGLAQQPPIRRAGPQSPEARVAATVARCVAPSRLRHDAIPVLAARG